MKGFENNAYKVDTEENPVQSASFGKFKSIASFTTGGATAASPPSSGLSSPRASSLCAVVAAAATVHRVSLQRWRERRGGGHSWGAFIEPSRSRCAWCNIRALQYTNMLAQGIYLRELET